MIVVNDDILKIADEASIKILVDDEVVNIKHIFRLWNKSTLGTLVFLCGGLFLMIAPIFKTSDFISKMIGIVLGFFLLIFSIITLIKQVTDGLKIKGKIITYQRHLKKTTIPLHVSMKIKMKTEIFKVRRAGTLGSDFIHVTYYLIDHDK